MARLNEKLTRVGFFGGTFDPPHQGHLTLAEEAKRQFALDSVMWVLAPQSPQKQSTFATVDERLSMVRAITTENDAFECCEVDVNRAGPYYTVDTARLIRALLPEQARLYFILGADSLKHLPRWYQAKELVFDQLDGIIAAQRSGYHLDLSALDQALPGIRDRIQFLEMPEMNLSSMQIRQMIQNREPVDDLLPQSVIRKVEDLKLYQDQ
ncbi:MAG: nicotinate (nicotinamide) nucleotide adenylyltransferase [Anaerolineaceae bacterium]|nr:nicotinate (nicotinamide) nucleotide adenylyltransferase [Anaerolineaceae bacterium]